VENHSSSPGNLVSRRTALKVGLAGIVGVAVGGAVGGGSASVIARLGRSAPSNFRFFTDDEAALLIEICEQIIPGDDMPGAKETGAIHFIDRKLCGVFKHHQQAYRNGLEAFRQTCLREHGLTFESLNTAAKVEALRAIESGHAPQDLWEQPTQQAFFRLVLAHTMQSFYGSPRHGGNKDYASYRMLGIDYPPVVGRNRPQRN
jgi:gluconate 2-dehydrogenase gamma chain